jgi:polar amino acid transport system substrate-binding protein
MQRAALALIVGVIALIGGLSCKDRGTSGDGGVPRSTLDVVKADGRLIIGIGQEAAPFGYREKDELVGFDADIARAVAARLETYLGRKVDVVFRPVTDETRISWVQSGEVHLSLCHTNITRKRLANIDFTVPYGWDGKGVLYDLRKGPRDLKDFAGKVIGIKRSSSSEGEIQAYFAAQGWAKPELKQFDNHVTGIQAVMDGQIDGFTDDNSIIICTATKAGHKVGPDGPLAVTMTPYSPTYFGIGVHQNDSLWRDTLNYCLQDLWNNGEYQKIYAKWFGPESICPMPLGDHHMEPFVQG